MKKNDWLGHFKNVSNIIDKEKEEKEGGERERKDWLFQMNGNEIQCLVHDYTSSIRNKTMDNFIGKLRIFEYDYIAYDPFIVVI